MDKRRENLDKKIRGGLLKVSKYGSSEDVVKFYNDHAREYNEVRA